MRHELAIFVFAQMMAERPVEPEHLDISKTNSKFCIPRFSKMHQRYARRLLLPRRRRSEASGLALMPEIVSTLMPGPRPSLAWLDYGRHDAPMRHLLQKARRHGAAATWEAIKDARLSIDDRLWIARGLIAVGLAEDGLWLRERCKEATADDSA